MITGWSIPIKNKIIMNGDVTYGYEKIILAGALGSQHYQEQMYQD